MSILPTNMRLLLVYGSFLKWGYPQIIHLNRIFHYKRSILGIPHWWKPRIRTNDNEMICSKQLSDIINIIAGWVVYFLAMLGETNNSARLLIVILTILNSGFFAAKNSPSNHPLPQHLPRHVSMIGHISRLQFFALHFFNFTFVVDFSSTRFFTSQKTC